MGEFTNKVALVTGAAAGIGSATALAFAEAGAAVVLADRDVAAGQAVAETIRGAGGETLFVEVDVAAPPLRRRFDAVRAGPLRPRGSRL